MAWSPPTSEELTGRRYYPKPHMPPNMNREQAWAWALDNFEALSRLSCQHPQCHESGYASIFTLDGVAYAAERGQKLCSELHAKEPMAETEERLWTPPEVGGASSREAHWALNRPGDDSVYSNGEMRAQSESWSTGRPWKLRKTEAYAREEPGKKRHPSHG